MERQFGRPVSTKQEAEALADQWRTEIRSGTFRLYSESHAAPFQVTPTAPALTFAGAAALWLEDSGTGGGAKLVAAKDHKYRLGRISKFVLPGGETFGSLAFDAVTADHIEAYRAARKADGKSVVTVNHDLKLLRLIFNWGIRRKHLVGTPFRVGHLAEIRLEREEGRNRRLDDEDVETRLLRAATPHLRDVIVAMLDTACRPGEVLSLQWRDVSLARREIIIRAEKAKTKRSRLIPMSNRLHAVLDMRRLDPAGQQHPPAAFVFGDEIGRQVRSVRDAWQAACKAVGLHGFQLRDLRHEAASRFEQAGVSVTLVSQLLGHTNLTTTTRYLNTLRRELHRAVTTLEAAGFAKRLQTEEAESQESAPAAAANEARNSHPS
jgi:integrase